MIATPNFPNLNQSQDKFRTSLCREGFVDDGEKLRGRLTWKVGGVSYEGSIDISLDENFPFSPPKVQIVDSSITPTFHIERNGSLCLYAPTSSLDLPWLDVKEFLNKVVGWFKETTKGWPGDIDADLERYLELDDKIVVFYDEQKIGNGFFRTTPPNNGVVHVTDELFFPVNLNRLQKRELRRKEKRLIWVTDIGEISAPIRSWSDLVGISTQDMGFIRELIDSSRVDFILVRYKRAGRAAPRASLVMKVERKFGSDPYLFSVESADKSQTTRYIRSGGYSPRYARKSVVIIGCGAVGSHMADLLFRSGVGKLTLVDPEKLRPGNLVRHLVGDSATGINKALAVKAHLKATGLDVENVTPVASRLVDVGEAKKYLEEYNLVIDATASSRVSNLLGWAAEEFNGHILSICLQREGGIVRIDRYPLFDEEQHLPAIPNLSEGSRSRLYEAGCGSPVSRTSPLSVVRAATLGSQYALNMLGGVQNLPPTQIEVIEPQPDPPYNEVGLLVKS